MASALHRLRYVNAGPVSSFQLAAGKPSSPPDPSAQLTTRNIALLPPIAVRVIPTPRLLAAGPDAPVLPVAWRYLLPETRAHADYLTDRRAMGHAVSGAPAQAFNTAVEMAVEAFSGCGGPHVCEVVDFPGLRLEALAVRGAARGAEVVAFFVYKDVIALDPPVRESAGVFAARLCHALPGSDEATAMKCLAALG